MQQVNKVLLLEFNELSPFLLDKWMGEGKLPNFKKFHDNSMVYVSKPDVEESELLEPWIQWFSMHVGVGYQEHKVFHLTDGEKANNLDIWSINDSLIGNYFNIKQLLTYYQELFSSFGFPLLWQPEFCMYFFFL